MTGITRKLILCSGLLFQNADNILMKSNIQDLIQRIVINTSFPPLTYFYRKIYERSIAVATLLLKRVDGVLTVYLRRGVAKGEIVYGLSDIDLLVIVNDEDKGRLVKERVRATYDKLSHFIPLFGSGDRELEVYSASEFLNVYNDYDFYRYRFNDGKYTWKLLFGKDMVKALPQLEDFELCLPATEELKTWWTLLNAEFILHFTYPRFRTKYLWYKAISEASKIYLFVCHGKHIPSREAALCEVKNCLAHEHQCHIDKIQSYLRHLTLKEDLISDELIKLFIILVAKTFEEMERKVYGDSKGKMAIVNVPSYHDLMPSNGLAKLVQELEISIRGKLEPYLDSVALIPQVEFDVDALSNSDIDSFYLALIQKNSMPIEKLRKFCSLFGENFRQQNIEPFVVAGGNIALSLQVDNPLHCIKSPRKCPLFFSLLPKSTSNLLECAVEGSDNPIRCYLPPNTFEQTIKKRMAKIMALILDKNIYKMKTLDFLRFFWGAARTKLLAHSLEREEIHIPLTSGQILEMLLQSFPEDSDWLKGLHREYTKELLGEENEAYRFFSKSIALLKRM